MKRTLMFIAIVIGAYGIVSGLLLNLKSGTPATAQELPDVVPSAYQLLPEQVIHQRIETYRRYGPSTAETAASEEVSIPPEYGEMESWQKLNNTASSIAQSYGVFRDSSGTPVQTTTVTNGKVRLTDNLTGELILDVSIADVPINDPLKSGTAFLESLANGSGRVVDESVSRRKIEYDYAIRDLISSGPLAVPYFSDLSPVKLVHQGILNSDGALESVKVYAEKPAGERTLIQADVIVLFEITDSMPEGIY